MTQVNAFIEQMWFIFGKIVMKKIRNTIGFLYFLSKIVYLNANLWECRYLQMNSRKNFIQKNLAVFSSSMTIWISIQPKKFSPQNIYIFSVVIIWGSRVKKWASEWYKQINAKCCIFFWTIISNKTFAECSFSESAPPRKALIEAIQKKVYEFWLI